MEPFVTTVALIGIVIVVASLLSGAPERTGAPLAAVFLALGAVLGPWGLGLVDIGLESASLRALAVLGLALVLFSDAVTINTAEVMERRRLAWRVLGPGTLLPAAAITVAARLLLGVPWPAAAILGAALASTDPVLLRSVLRSTKLPAVPRIALRLESGMNDAALLPIVVIAMLLLRDPAATGEHARGLGESLVGLFVLGPVLGAAVGWIGITVLARIRSGVGVRRDYESLYALGLAFSAFAAAEAVGGSGFLAAFTAGLVIAAQDVELCDCFLEYGEATAEMLLLLTFVALGTSLIWTGLDVIGPTTLAFAAIALTVRTVALLPILRGMELTRRDRWIIALIGPRGLSSLLFVLLPVFAGIAGAEELFTIVCLVVLLSVVLHGGGIALFLRGSRGPRQPLATAADPTLDVPPALDERIALDEALTLLRASTPESPVMLVDVRRERNWRVDPVVVTGSVRMPPDDPVRSATELRLAKHATLLVYCA